MCSIRMVVQAGHVFFSILILPDSSLTLGNCDAQLVRRRAQTGEPLDFGRWGQELRNMRIVLGAHNGHAMLGLPDCDFVAQGLRHTSVVRYHDVFLHSANGYLVVW